MASIVTTRADVIWNYIGTVTSMASGFILLPFLVAFLSDAELGLWYVYIALANFAMLFEFGFSPTFARNIVYVVSGARSLSAKGRGAGSGEEVVDWHLLNVVIKASKVVYAVIALFVAVLLCTVGSAYVTFITVGMDSLTVWASWVLFCVAIFLNLYFLWTITVLRGYGDVAGEKKASTVAKLVQLVLSGVLLFFGFGLLGASIGYLACAVTLRVMVVLRMRCHRELQEGRRGDVQKVTRSEIGTTLGSVSHIAWRDGLVTIALYMSTQAMSLMSSAYLGLAQTGTYSLLLQLSTAVYNFAVVYPKSFYPAMQSAFAENDLARQRRFVSTGVVAYWAFFCVGMLGVGVVILPLVPLIKPGVSVDYSLFAVMCIYLGLLQHHSLFCNYIVCRNEIPYMCGYIVAAVLGVALVYVCTGVCGLGAYGIVLGQAVSQLLYNNWKWPRYLSSELGTTYAHLCSEGLSIWRNRLFKR